MVVPRARKLAIGVFLPTAAPRKVPAHKKLTWLKHRKVEVREGDALRQRPLRL